MKNHSNDDSYKPSSWLVRFAERKRGSEDFISSLHYTETPKKFLSVRDMEVTSDSNMDLTTYIKK